MPLRKWRYPTETIGHTRCGVGTPATTGCAPLAAPSPRRKPTSRRCCHNPSFVRPKRLLIPVLSPVRLKRRRVRVLFDNFHTSNKNDFCRGCLFVPAPRWLGCDRRNILDGNLATERPWRFHIHFRRVARLLTDLLMRRWFVADVKKLRRIGGEEKDARFFRYARIGLVQNCSTERESL